MSDYSQSKNTNVNNVEYILLFTEVVNHCAKCDCYMENVWSFQNTKCSFSTDQITQALHS